VSGIHNCYQAYTRYNSISLVEFIDRVLQQYMPEEHFDILSEQEKTFFLHKIIIDVIADFCKQVLQIDMLKMVIDNHKFKENTRIWLDKIVDVQLMIREKIFCNFAKQGSPAGTRQEQVDIGIVNKIREDRDKIWDELQHVLGEKCALAAELEKAKRMVEILYAELNKSQQLVINLRESAAKKIAEKEMENAIEQTTKSVVIQAPVIHHADESDDSDDDFENERENARKKLKEKFREKEARSGDAGGAADNTSDEAGSADSEANTFMADLDG